MLVTATTRKRKRIAKRTKAIWQSSLDNWLNPAIGNLPLSEVNNATVKPLIADMAEALGASSIQSHLTLIKLVVASAVDNEGEQLYPVKWNHDFMDVPVVVDREVNCPCFPEPIMSGLARRKHRTARTIFTLCGASGLRIGEVLGLDLARHFSKDFRVLVIEQKAIQGLIEKSLKTASSWREVDLDPRVASLIKEFAGERTSGLLFQTRTGKPLRPEYVLRWHLHPALKQLGYVNPITGNHLAGFHSFRRYRETHLGKVVGLPRAIRIFWMGHAEENMTDLYDKGKEDPDERRKWAERCGIGFDLPASGLVVPISERKGEPGQAA
jgi:integrase